MCFLTDGILCLQIHRKVGAAEEAEGGEGAAAAEVMELCSHTPVYSSFTDADINISTD